MEALADEVGRMLTTLAIRLRNPTAQGLPPTLYPGAEGGIRTHTSLRLSGF